MSEPQPHANNFLAAEPDIVARLKAALSGQTPAVHVLTEDDLDGVKENAQLVPAVHVIYASYKPLESSSRRDQASLEHTWLVVAAVRNVASGRKGSAAARKAAGELLACAGAALMGFKPTNCMTPLRLVPAPRGSSSNGYVYLPLAFAAESLFRAA